jgi:hypothetical protein
MKVARLLGIAEDDEAWQDIVDTTGELVQDAFANLDSA